MHVSCIVLDKTKQGAIKNHAFLRLLLFLLFSFQVPFILKILFHEGEICVLHSFLPMRLCDSI